MTIAAILVVSESEIATVMPEFNLQWSKDNPEKFKQMLYELGFDVSKEVECQEGLTHRNRFGAVITCARWVGDERIDKEYVKSNFASQAAKDKSLNNRMLNDLYKQKGMVE